MQPKKKRNNIVFDTHTEIQRGQSSTHEARSSSTKQNGTLALNSNLPITQRYVGHKEQEKKKTEKKTQHNDRHQQHTHMGKNNAGRRGKKSEEDEVDLTGTLSSP